MSSTGKKTTFCPLPSAAVSCDPKFILLYIGGDSEKAWVLKMGNSSGGVFSKNHYYLLLFMKVPFTAKNKAWVTMLSEMHPSLPSSLRGPHI